MKSKSEFQYSLTMKITSFCADKIIEYFKFVLASFSPCRFINIFCLKNKFLLELLSTCNKFWNPVKNRRRELTVFPLKYKIYDFC